MLADNHQADRLTLRTEFVKRLWALCRGSMILSPCKCSMKMSPYEGDGDIQQERAQEIDGIESSGDGQDDREGGS